MEQELIKNGRMIALKIIAESYMIIKGAENTEEIFPRNITKDTTITGEETLILHNWLLEEYKNMGLDLKKVIAESGESNDGKRLSRYEINELVRRADALLIQMGILKQYLDNK